MNPTAEVERRVRELARAEDPWQRVKDSGVAGIPSGDATQAWRRLDAALCGLGVFVVPVGILERWNPDVGGHGPSWTVEVLEAGFHETDGPHAAFVSEVDASIG
jgi:hypothetical protein